MNPKVPPKYAELQRERILDAAWELFADRGYHDTTMREVAAKLGMSTGVVYTHFTGKGEIIAALAERSRRKRAAMLRRLLEEDSLRSALTALLEILAETCVGDESRRGAKANVSLLAEAVKGGEIGRHASALYRDAVDVFTRLAEGGVRRGEFVSGVDAAAVGKFMSALFLGLQMESVLMSDTDSPKHVRAIGRILLGNIWAERSGEDES